MNKVEWSYYDKFDELEHKYLPISGEGETKANQIVTAICKLIYKWYNDGDVFDNTCYLIGWANDLSSYANWLAKYVDGAKDILDNVFLAKNDDDYEELLQQLADTYLKEEILQNYESNKEGSIYDCEGDYEFIEFENDYEEEWY